MFKRKTLATILVLALSLIMVLTGCGSSNKGGTSGSTDEKLNVMLYSSLKDTQLAALKEKFTAKYPHVNMDYYTAGTGNVMTKLATEQQAGGISADLIWVGDPTNYINFKADDLLYPYDSPAAKEIPDKFKDPDRMYISGRLIMLGFVYNTNMLTAEEAPKTWDDLLKPEFKDYVGMTDPTSAGTTFNTVAGLVQHPNYGWDYFRALKENGVKLENGSSGVVNKVGAGEYKVAIGVDYIARSVKAQGSPVDFIYPADNIPVIESPIAIIKNTKNLEAAKLLYDFIISEEGQQILLEEYTFPINPNMALEDAIPVTEAEAKMLPVDNQKLAEDKVQILETFDSIFK
ncbi:ABC transporter substrate-binding protein [Proteiniborus ethanoligenes]|uniref:ABC transporter substrate-binding protein n=1 Tax=Proteiniborus ethanoligenes TaxID=415015 RepID=UPI000B813A15|nr:ABC transporter substrate-binding protein [Proteiniborus ethanoligenes]